MRVLIVDASFNDKNGTTKFGLDYLVNELGKFEIEVERYVLRDKAQGYNDFEKMMEDSAAELCKLVKEADGLVWAGQEKNGSVNAECKMLMDRFFDVCPDEDLQFKGASPFVTLRRDGGSATHNQMTMYFLSHHMYVVPASYMRIMHCETVEDAKRDVEALEALESLAQTFNWYFTLRKLAKEDGIEEPTHEKRVYSNYIRPETDYEF